MSFAHLKDTIKSFNGKISTSVSANNIYFVRLSKNSNLIDTVQFKILRI